jgi:hypothetical protein
MFLELVLLLLHHLRPLTARPSFSEFGFRSRGRSSGDKSDAASEADDTRLLDLCDKVDLESGTVARRSFVVPETRLQRVCQQADSTVRQSGWIPMVLSWSVENITARIDGRREPGAHVFKPPAVAFGGMLDNGSSGVTVRAQPVENGCSTQRLVYRVFF